MNANLAVIADNLDYLLWGRLAEGQPGGVALTLLMAIGATALALPGGILLACAAWRYGGAVRRLLFLWAEIIRGIPLIFVIFWLWYLLPMLTGGDLPGAVTVTLALAWFTAASVMHSVLAGLRALPGGQHEAALTQGFAPGQTLRLILLPQALRNVQPSLVGIFIAIEPIVDMARTALNVNGSMMSGVLATRLLKNQRAKSRPVASMSE